MTPYVRVITILDDLSETEARHLALLRQLEACPALCKVEAEDACVRLAAESELKLHLVVNTMAQGDRSERFESI